MTFIDLFSGIGGFRVGMEMAGHKCLGHCEVDNFANYSYISMHLLDNKELDLLKQLNIRQAQKYLKNRKQGDEWYARDIREVRANDIPKCDCWCFGFPCQDISVAGKRRGIRGNRSSLFFTTTKLIRELEAESKPTYLFIENVKNLLSINGGFDFAKVLIELDEIGYNAEWQVINSAEFGVPQNRERVFIIGRLRGSSGRKVFPISGTTSKTIKQVGNLVNNTGWKNPQRGRIYSVDGIGPALNCCGGGGCETKIVIPVLTPERVNKRQNGRRFKQNGEPMFTLTSQDRHGVALNGYNGLKIRKLTPREYFRLQGFPDKYFDKARLVNSDSQLYKQAGNGVTVNVIYAIAQKLKCGK